VTEARQRLRLMNFITFVGSPDDTPSLYTHRLRLILRSRILADSKFVAKPRESRGVLCCLYRKFRLVEEEPNR